MSVRFDRFQPHPLLRPHVRFYYAVRTGPVAPAPIVNHPQGGVDLVFGFTGRTGFVGGGGQRASFADFGISVLGLQDGPCGVQLGTGLERFCVAFEPEGFARLVGLPLSDVVNRGRSVRDHVDDDLRALHERLGEAADDATRVALVDALLVERLRRSLDRRASDPRWPYARLEPLLRELRLSGGRRSLGELASAANVSGRTVQRWTRDVLGMGPKTYSRIVRFTAALKLMEEHPRLDWHDVLVRAGYYDQSHFIAEFRRFAGVTPLVFARGDVRLSRLFTGGEVERLELMD
ncbi:transcriptional activator FtrA [Planctomycetes bacterium Pla163]|uniref:Transcriptional activator FtrA n=1 Tax=Rohdeia mirabilis TaxID=2528008 RepID=A0A518D1A9_9BACT|nr:transcriptional activator FtrA [Planctomycetes bacterium Pla163]